MSAVVTKPNIQEYHDYLEFLKDWFDFLKDQNKGFSLRKVAKEAGMASGYLSMCFSGKRKLSQNTFEKLLPFLGLSAKEAKYLDLLRTIAESESPKQRVQALTDLQKMKDYKVAHQSELEVHQYLSRWYYVAIRELANSKSFQANPAWIQERLRGRVSQKEIQDALEFLTKFGFLVQDATGGFSVGEKQLDCHEGVYKISLGEFHRQMLDWAKASIEEVPRTERLLLGHTAAITAEQYESIQSILKEALAKIERLGSVDSSDSVEVYHVELATFPLSKKSFKGGESVGE